MIKLGFCLISIGASGWLAQDKPIRLGSSHDMGIREKLQGRNSHILKGNKGKKMLVDSRKLIQECIHLCISFCNILV